MNLAGLFGGGVAAAGGYAAVQQLQNMLRGLGEDAQEGATGIANQAMQDTQFRPYTVSSNLANVGTNAQGGFDLNLSPQQRAMQNQMFGRANNMFSQAGQGMTLAERQAQNQMFGQSQNMFRQAGQGLSRAEQARERSLFNQAGTMFNQVGQGMSRDEQKRQRNRLSAAESLYKQADADPSKLAGDYYENIRAAQRPEEERQRMNLDQGLFSSGRGGISTAEFGGTAEEFAFEKARAEAGLQASAQARSMALGEQQQALGMANQLTGDAYNVQNQQLAREQQALQMGGNLMGQSFLPQQQRMAEQQNAMQMGTSLFGQSFMPEQQAIANQQALAGLGSQFMNQGYMPQQQALSMFGASQIPAQLAQQSQLSGAELRAQLEQSGLEGLLSAGVSEASSTAELYKAIINGLSSGATSLFTD